MIMKNLCHCGADLTNFGGNSKTINCPSCGSKLYLNRGMGPTYHKWVKRPPLQIELFYLVVVLLIVFILILIKNQ